MAVPRLFIDASVWIAAVASTTGGSAAVLELSWRGLVRLVASKQVLGEAQRNIKVKLSSEALLSFYRYLGSLPLEIAPEPSPEELAEARQAVGEKDAHVLAAALKARADALVTLDRKHLLTPAARAASAVVIHSPGEFLQGFTV
jgi:putative PIN family toxin of toxin-antitoxin system